MASRYSLPASQLRRLAALDTLEAVLEALPEQLHGLLQGVTGIAEAYNRLERAGAEDARKVLHSGSPPISRAFAYLLLRWRESALGAGSLARTPSRPADDQDSSRHVRRKRGESLMFRAEPLVKIRLHVLASEARGCGTGSGAFRHLQSGPARPRSALRKPRRGLP